MLCAVLLPALAIAAALLAGAPATALAAEVTAEGRASIHNNNTSGARSQALKNAQRSAVEQGIGVLVHARTQAENHAIISEKILTASEGFITKYEILSEGPQSGGEYYRVRIRAQVAEALLKERLSALRILQAQAGQPRVMVLHRKGAPHTLPRTHNMSQSALLAMREALNQAGFRVFDAEATAKVYRGIEQAARIDRPDEALAALALDAQADWVVLQEILAGKRGAKGGLFAAAYATIRVRVVDATTGRNIANTETRAKQLLKPAAGPYDWEVALASAARKAASQAGEKTIARLTEILKTRGSRGQGYLLVFRGFNDDEKDQILDFLEGSPGFRQLAERQNTLKLLEVELFSTETPSRLRRIIRLGLRKEGIGLSIQSASRTRIVFLNAKDL